MAWTLGTSGAAIARAGENANSTIVTSGATLEKWSDEAEGFLCLQGHTDFVTGYANYDTQIKNALSRAHSALVASDIAAYSPNSYTADEWNAIMNYNDETYTKALALIKDKVKQRLSE